MNRTVLILALTAAAGLASPTLAATGAQLYGDNCAACHQADGAGIAGAFPALAGDKLVAGDPNVLAATVLNGRGGMPAFKADLDDADLAAILSYVRAAWSNKAAPLSATEVAGARTGAVAPRPPGHQAH